MGYSRREGFGVGREVVGGRDLGGTAPPAGSDPTGWPGADKEAGGGTAQGSKGEKGFAERLEKANGEISALRGNVESARADVMVASSKNSQLLSQLKGNQVEHGALVEELREMREELGEQKSQFCKQVAELQSNLSAVCSQRDATVCLCENTQVDAELFQSQVERLECERCELTVSRKTSELAGCMDLYISPEHSNQGSLPARAGRG